jgi:hypothetical protein
MEVWAATSSWRGDPKLFGRIVQRARDEVRKRGHPDPCRIEFAVGAKDVDRYESVEDMLALVPAGTLRAFGAARVQIGTGALRLEMRFGRDRKLPLGLSRLLKPRAAFSCPPGITFEVGSDGPVGKGELEAVRTAVAAVIARGGFFWARFPTPVDDGGKLDEVRARRWRMRELSAQLVFLAIAVGLLLTMAAADRLLGPDGDEGPFSAALSEPLFLVGVLGASQLISYPLATVIFPGIDIADITPGRRMLQVVGRSGVVTTAVGLAAKALFST